MTYYRSSAGKSAAPRSPGNPVTIPALSCSVLPVCALLILSITTGCGSDQAEVASTRAPDPRTEGPFPFTHDPKRLDEIGEQTCVECHAESVADWQQSHHAKANRPIDPEIDRDRFVPEREVVEGNETYRLFWRDDRPFMQAIAEGESNDYELQGTIGYVPLVQYLAKVSGGKWQTTTAAFAPADGEWFDIFEGQGRRQGEWGHWAGQGLNWNANCAYCHMTEYHKNLDPPTGTYDSTWTRQSISCIQCHSGLEAHRATALENDPGVLPRSLTPKQIMDSCATCHSRRDQLTPETFRPGDKYADHFDLTLPENPGLYYADGQIRDEVFVWGSYQMSKMGHAGISCMDCHDPHSMQLTRPVANNATCTSCHDEGLDGAPVIVPVEHSFHPEDSLGNRCVECHMPKTVYMGNDPRADHGFLSPDPLMTRELGIPNACSNCHTEETVEWAEEKVAEWYPDSKVLKAQRERARALTLGWEQDPAAAGKLLRLAEGEPISAWKATYTGLLEPFAADAAVARYIEESLTHPNPLVRQRAVYAAGMNNLGGPRFDRFLDDSILSVRLEAARTYVFRGEKIPDASVREEWNEYLLFNSDRPQTALLLADEALENGRTREASMWIERALALEERNAELKRRAGVLYSRLGNLQRAAVLIQDAWDIEPENPNLPYSLALLRAEEERWDETTSLLKVAVRLDPGFQRAWYNLSIALLRSGEFEAASHALEMARTGIPEEEYIGMVMAIQRARNEAESRKPPPGIRLPAN